MHTILQRLQEIFSRDRIANSVAHFAPRFVIGLIVFLVFYLLYRVLNFLLARVTRRAQVEPTAATFLLMAVKYVVKGCRDKATALRDFSAAAKLNLAQVCFMGDDVNDLRAMEIAGVSAAPANAAAVVLKQADFVAKASGGNGAVRELVDALLAARGLTPQEAFAKK